MLCYPIPFELIMWGIVNPLFTYGSLFLTRLTAVAEPAIVVNTGREHCSSVHVHKHASILVGPRAKTHRVVITKVL